MDSVLLIPAYVCTVPVSFDFSDNFFEVEKALLFNVIVPSYHTAIGCSWAAEAEFDVK